MKKRTKIALIILVILIAVIAGLCIWQWDNLMAVKTSLGHSREDLSQMMEQNNQRVDAVQEQLPGVTVRDLTDEEKAALRDNTLDREELIDRLVGKEQPAESSPSPGEAGQPAEPVPAESPSPSPSQDPEEAKRDQLARYIAEIYLMKAEYTAWLEAEHNAAIEEFVALPKDQQTTAAKYQIGMKHMKVGLEKEEECDQKMAEIEGKIQALLKELGEDTSLVDEIQAAYEEEKELKKAYYLGLH